MINRVDKKRLKTLIQKQSPLLWLGAGASRQATPPIPTLWELVTSLQEDYGWESKNSDDPYVIIDEFLDLHGQPGDLQQFLERKIRPNQRDPKPGILHHYLAQLAANEKFSGIIDTNYDLLLRSAMNDVGARHSFTVLDEGIQLSSDNAPRYVCLHGSKDNWRDVVLTGESYNKFAQRYKMLVKHLDLTLLQNIILFVGCSLEDPRILDWLKNLRSQDKQDLKTWIAIVGPNQINRLESLAQEDPRYTHLLQHIQFFELNNFEELPELFSQIQAPIVSSHSSSKKPSKVSILLEQSEKIAKLFNELEDRGLLFLSDGGLKSELSKELYYHGLPIKSALKMIEREKNELEAKNSGRSIIQLNLSNNPTEDGFPDYANCLLDIFDTTKLDPVDEFTLRRKLRFLQDQQHESWILGDYIKLQEVGEAFIELAKKCSEPLLFPNIAHLGNYLVGEGKRLQSIKRGCPDHKKSLLLQDSAAAYSSSRALIPKDSGNYRSIRGLGKVKQNSGDLDKAFTLYSMALNMSKGIESPGPFTNWYLARHEELRAWRHLIDLVIKMGAESPWNEDKIIKNVHFCHLSHQDLLRQISMENDWILLEEFMTYSFLGGALLQLSLEKPSTMESGYDLLSKALNARANMLKSPYILDERLRENLEWLRGYLGEDVKSKNIEEEINSVLERQDDEPGDLQQDLRRIASNLKS